MAAAGIRQSKYRNIFGKPEQLRNCFQSIRLGTTSPDNIPIQANKTFFAVPWHVKGSLAIVPISQPGAVDHDELPLIIQDEEVPFNDFAFNPFDDHLVALASNDGLANLYRIPEGGLTANVTEPEKSISGNKSRLVNVSFHPLASEVLLTCAGNKDVKLFDINAGEEKITLPSVHKGQITTFSWNAEGSLLATSAKDKELRIFDPRGQTLVSSVTSHDSPKGARAIWLGNQDLIVSCGFTKDSTREVAIFDAKMLGKGALATKKLTVSSSYMIPYYDEDTSLLYLAGKGDGNIRIFEVTNESPCLHEMLEFKSNIPQTGLAALPKTSLAIGEVETARFLKLTPKDGVIPIRFFVPRMVKEFQADVFPDTFDGKPSMTADEWFGGANTPANKISLGF